MLHGAQVSQRNARDRQGSAPRASPVAVHPPGGCNRWASAIRRTGMADDGESRAWPTPPRHRGVGRRRIAAGLWGPRSASNTTDSAAASTLTSSAGLAGPGTWRTSAMATWMRDLDPNCGPVRPRGAEGCRRGLHVTFQPELRAYEPRGPGGRAVARQWGRRLPGGGGSGAGVPERERRPKVGALVLASPRHAMVEGAGPATPGRVRVRSDQSRASQIGCSAEALPLTK